MTVAGISMLLPSALPAQTRPGNSSQADAERDAMADCVRRSLKAAAELSKGPDCEQYLQPQVKHGIRGAQLLKTNRYIEAPDGMTWLACWLQFSRVDPRRGGPTIVTGGPYLIPLPADFSAVKQKYMDSWRTEYLQLQKPQEFAHLTYTPEAARNHGCIIGSFSGTTAPVLGEHEKKTAEFVRTGIVPVFVT